MGLMQRKRLRRRPRQQPGQLYQARLRVVQWGILSLFAVLLVRAVMLHIFPAAEESLSNIADNQYSRRVELAPWRGTIFDRRGDPLAISIRKPSLAINPRVFSPSSKELHKLAAILRLPVRQLRKTAAKKGYFAWVARQIDHRQAEQAKNLELKGLFEVSEPARFYPASEAGAHLVGFVGIDSNGLIGLERRFDRDLRGQSVHLTSGRDAYGNTIFSKNAAIPEKTGNNVHLTIDRVIQEIAEEELVKGLKAAESVKGFAIVADPHTGRILAVANYPRFDPNNTTKLDIKRTRNHAFADVFEPGSTTKPFVAAAAIDASKTRIDSIHDCENGHLRIGRSVIHDTHPAKTLTTAQSIIESSNICIYKIAQKLGRSATERALRDFGIAGGRETRGIGWAGRGYLSPSEKWRDIRFATVSFGQGLLTTGLELVQAMGVIANGGTLVKHSLVEKIVSSDGTIVGSSAQSQVRRVISPETARAMRKTLHDVVDLEEGTGNNAVIPRWTTAGKTGTAQKVDPGIKGYAKDKYIASFLGFAPVKDPHLVVYVLVDEPKKKPYYGGVWAAPIFAGITERTLNYLNVAADRADASELDDDRDTKLSQSSEQLAKDRAAADKKG